MEKDFSLKSKTQHQNYSNKWNANSKGVHCVEAEVCEETFLKKREIITKLHIFSVIDSVLGEYQDPENMC